MKVTVIGGGSAYTPELFPGAVFTPLAGPPATGAVLLALDAAREVTP